ncbi:FAST kinase domain-containing protein 2, mitochondrial [Salmo trutta]|uniref:FAST kinase domains 2 n=1 Tax=Salmo trutta TaxID=8032 RepID=A0A674DB64_SALTR|nr:FAST kinase domain-containing protein 2, mitochondrial [Salmo trutta]XP_029596610.1 FAST kinase domain-containing protein 2, mitochondrial [Salmo trutta]
MTARTAEVLLRWPLRICNHRRPWQHRGPQMLMIESFDRGLSHIWSTGPSHRPLAGLTIYKVRYYSQGKTYGQDVVERKQGNSIQTQSSETWSSQSRTSPDQPAKRVPFYDQLRECGSPSDVLDLAGQYTATHRRVSNCLTRCWESTKKMSEEQRRYELRIMFEHAGFEELLQRTMQDARHMRSEDLAYSLLATVKLGVSQRSRVVQTLLRVCQENLNEFDEKSLSVLASCLEHLESSPNGDALKEGVRLMIEALLPSIQNVMSLQTLMRHMGRDTPVDIKKKLERKALSLADQFTLPNSQYMITTLASMGFCSKPLLAVCSRKIAEHVHGVPFNRLVNVLRAYKELHSRDVALFTAISDYVASSISMWNNKQLILFLSAFEDLAFCPTAMLDAFAERVTKNPDALGLKDVLSVLKTYSSLNHNLQDYREPFLEGMTHVVVSYLPKMAASELLKVVYFLCLLGHFPAAPLEQLLQQETLEEISARGGRLQKGMEKKLQIVDLCLRLDRPSLPKPLTVPPEALGSPAPNDLSINPGLSMALQSIAQEGLLQEGMMVEDLYFIDGVITQPKPLQEATGGRAPSEGEFLPPEHSQRIAVFCAPPSSFCYGTSRPRGNLAMKMRHLTVLGYTPVVVLEHELDNLSEEERTELLKTRIFPEQERPANVEKMTD